MKHLFIPLLFLIITINKLYSQNTDSTLFFKYCSSEVFTTAESRPSHKMGMNGIEDLVSEIELNKSTLETIQIFFRVNCEGHAIDFRLIKNEMANDIERKVFEKISSLINWTPAQFRGHDVNSNNILLISIKRGKVKVKFAGYSSILGWSDPRFKDNLQNTK